MIDTDNGRHENAVNAQSVTVTQTDGSTKPLDEVLTDSGATYTLPAATKDAIGGVKLTPFATTFPDVANAAGETPTAAEFNALASAVNRIKDALVSSGVVSIPS